MTKQVTELYPHLSASRALRSLADDIDEGKHCDRYVVVAILAKDNTVEVFGMGPESRCPFKAIAILELAKLVIVDSGKDGE